MEQEAAGDQGTKKKHDVPRHESWNEPCMIGQRMRAMMILSDTDNEANWASTSEQSSSVVSTRTMGIADSLAGPYMTRELVTSH